MFSYSQRHLYLEPGTLDKKIKIGLLGVGHLGKIHLKCLQETDFEVIGVYDPDPVAQVFVKEHYAVPIYKSAKQLIVDCDAVDIVSTTITHYELARIAIEMGKHTFIEKPISSTLSEARELVNSAKENNVKVQIGHVERYNPAIVSLHDRKVSPKFLEGHRLTTFNSRGNDVSVVLDLMIHDLDLILHLVDSKVVDVQANGVCVVNNTPDICNARITFENGCVANLTASRISMKHMRKLRLFQENEYISLDFLNKETQIIKLDPVTDNSSSDQMTIDTSEGKKVFTMESPIILENNAIVDELNDFQNAIITDSQPTVSAQDGLRALELAYMIAEKSQ